MQPHVLVVEDEDALSELLSYNLKKEGFRVSLAADGEEAMMLTLRGEIVAALLVFLAGFWSAACWPL